MPRLTKMQIVTIDDNGNELGAEWVDIPPPDAFASNGLAHIESYVMRLLNASASFTSLLIATPDEQIAVGLWKRGGAPELSVSLEWRSEAERERGIRDFFAGRRLSTSHDYLAGNGDVPDATRCLGYFLPSDAHLITTLIKDVLQQIYRLREDAALDFTYEEHNA